MSDNHLNYCIIADVSTSKLILHKPQVVSCYLIQNAKEIKPPITRPLLYAREMPTHQMLQACTCKYCTSKEKKPTEGQYRWSEHKGALVWGTNSERGKIKTNNKAEEWSGRCLSSQTARREETLQSFSQEINGQGMSVRFSDNTPTLGNRHRAALTTFAGSSTLTLTLSAGSVDSSLFVVAMAASKKGGEKRGLVLQQISVNIGELWEVLALHFITTVTMKKWNIPSFNLNK